MNRESKPDMGEGLMKQPAGRTPPTMPGGPPAAPPNQQRGHGITRDARGEQQPDDASRARQVAAGEKAQRDAAANEPMSPGEPAGGE